MQGSPVYHIMSEVDTYDIVLISVIEHLCVKLLARNMTNQYRDSRLHTVFDKIDQIEKSYKGYLPDNYKNRASKFIDYMNTDLNSLLNDIKTIDRR